MFLSYSSILFSLDLLFAVHRTIFYFPKMKAQIAQRVFPETYCVIILLRLISQSTKKCKMLNAAVEKRAIPGNL